MPPTVSSHIQSNSRTTSIVGQTRIAFRGLEMSTFDTARHIVSAFADSGEEWKHEHDQVRVCWELEDAIKLGAYLFRHLTNLEARIQSMAINGISVPDDSFWEDIQGVYRDWLRGAEKRLAFADALTANGYKVEGLADFIDVVSECRCMLDNNAMEPEILPIEELMGSAKPDSPSPGRYGDID
jgi:hypothetical protein